VRAIRRTVVVAAIAMTFVLTRFRTYSNFRYFLPILPLLLILFLVAVARRVPGRPLRLGLVLALAGGFGASIFSTIDPVSRHVFGTFSIGKHELLDVTRRTQECCGHGRDQLVYSLEFTALPKLIDRALAAIHPTDKTAIVIDPLADWLVFGPLDRATWRRSFTRDGAFEAHVMDLVTLGNLDALPPEAFFFALGYVDNERDIGVLRTRYDIAQRLSFGYRGYALEVLRLRLRR
jgi:hypothetical protein